MDKEAQEARALAVLESIPWPDAGPLTLERNGLVLVFDAVPELQADREGNLIGVDAWVRLFRAGTEVRIDPHRRFMNPPTWHDDAYDPWGAYQEVLWQSVESYPAPEGWRTAGTVTTFYAGTGDGRVVSTDATYSNARAGSGLTSQTTSILFTGQTTGYEVYQSFLSFDTSALPDAAVISAVELAINGWGDSSTTDFTVEARLHDWGASLTTADWVAGANLTTKTLLATFASSGFVQDVYNAFTSDAAFVNNVSKTGTTYILLCSAEQTNNSAPTAQEFVNWWSADESGTTKDPKLTVTYTTPITGVSATATAAANSGTVVAQLAAVPAGTSATVSVAANPGTVTAGKGVNVAGVSATVSALANGGSVLPAVFIGGTSATVAMAASAGVVAAKQIASITGVSALLTLVARAGAITRAPLFQGSVELALRTVRVRTRHRSPSVTLGIRRR